MTFFNKEERGNMTKTDVQMLKNYIGGQWIEAETSQTESVYNPATGEIIAEVTI